MTALLVVGIHREERAFGEAVAAGLQGHGVEVLDIADGLSGRRPRADQRFRHDVLHRALYFQLLPHALGKHEMLIDLHAGLDPGGPSADLYCRDTAWLARRLGDSAQRHDLRLISLGHTMPGSEGDIRAKTMVPPEIWNHPGFYYIGMEIYLCALGAGLPAEHAYARALVEGLTVGTVDRLSEV